MDLTSPVIDSDSESDPDVLELDTDSDFANEEDQTTTTAGNHKIGSVWRDMVVGEQMEGCLTHLEVTSKMAGYTDMDDPNYKPMINERKRKRFTPFRLNDEVESVLVNDWDLESNYEAYKRYKTVTNYDYTNVNTKKFVKNKNNNSDNKTKGRILPAIHEAEEKSMDQFLNELCTNLHEHNKTLMLSVISKIERKVILEKYTKTCLIEADGGQMTKNGNRKRTSGGIFFNLIKEDKSIPNSAKKDLFGCALNEEIKKKKKKEKIKRRKEKLMKIVSEAKKKGDHLKELNEKQETLPSNSLEKTEDLTEPSNSLVKTEDLIEPSYSLEKTEDLIEPSNSLEKTEDLTEVN